MATKRPTRRKTSTPKKLKRGQAIRVPGAGTVTIGKGGEVVWRGTPLRPNPTRKRKPAVKAKKCNPSSLSKSWKRFMVEGLTPRVREKMMNSLKRAAKREAAGKVDHYRRGGAPAKRRASR